MAQLPTPPYLFRMCGRFALSMTPADLAGVFGTRNAVPNFAPTWNLPPSLPAPVVRHNPKTGVRSLDVLRWGLIPHFERDPAHARMFNNARAETVAKLPSFRGAFAARRCIVPADAFYEWKRDGKLKQPFAIARADGAPLAFGGIWESWTDPATVTSPGASPSSLRTQTAQWRRSTTACPSCWSRPTGRCGSVRRKAIRRCCSAPQRTPCSRGGR